MDETTKKKGRAAGHAQRQTAAGLPRHWVMLPRSVQSAALGHPLLKRLFPSHVGFFPEARGHSIERASGIDSVIFNYCIRGRGWCEVSARRFEVGPGELMVVPRGAPHAYGADHVQPWTIHWFHAQGSELTPLLRELGVSSSEPVLRVGQDPRLILLFEELRQLLEDDYSPPQLLYAAQLLTHLLGLLIRLRRGSLRELPGATERVLRTAQHVKEHLDLDLDVPTLAALAELSPSHFSALFRKLTGYTPSSYVTHVRIRRAAHLLATTTARVQAISRQLGYQDPLYFSRAFRQINGVSPSQYRELRRRSPLEIA